MFHVFVWMVSTNFTTYPTFLLNVYFNILWWNWWIEGLNYNYRVIKWWKCRADTNWKIFCASWINTFCSSTVCTSGTIPLLGRRYVYFMLTQLVHLWICFFMTKDDRKSACVNMLSYDKSWSKVSLIDVVEYDYVFFKIIKLWSILWRSNSQCI